MPVKLNKKLGRDTKEVSLYTKAEIDTLLTENRRLTERALSILGDGGGTGSLTKLQADSLYFNEDNNLSESTDLPTLRTNIGLGRTDEPEFAGVSSTGIFLREINAGAKEISTAQNLDIEGFSIDLKSTSSGTGLTVNNDASVDITTLTVSNPITQAGNTVIDNATTLFTGVGDNVDNFDVISGQSVQFAGGSGITTTATTGSPNVITFDFDGGISNLSDVALVALTDGQFLQYNSSSGDWENVDNPNTFVESADFNATTPFFMSLKDGDGTVVAQAPLADINISDLTNNNNTLNTSNFDTLISGGTDINISGTTINMTGVYDNYQSWEYSVDGGTTYYPVDESGGLRNQIQFAGIGDINITTSGTNNELINFEFTGSGTDTFVDGGDFETSFPGFLTLTRTGGGDVTIDYSTILTSQLTDDAGFGSSALWTDSTNEIYYEDKDVTATFGFTGGYGTRTGTTTAWASSIWTIGENFSSNESGTGFTISVNHYGLSWQRSTSNDANSSIGEGLYVWQNGALKAGMGENGLYVLEDGFFGGNVGIGVTPTGGRSLSVKDYIWVGDSSDLDNGITDTTTFAGSSGILIGDGGMLLDNDNTAVNLVSRNDIRFWVNEASGTATNPWVMFENGNLVAQSANYHIAFGDYQVGQADNTSNGLSVRATTNPPANEPIFIVESSGSAVRFGVTQDNGAWFRDGIRVGNYDAGSLTDAANDIINENGDVIASSDVRVKSDIKPIENALSTLRKINSYTFDKYGNPSIGYIAQEIEELTINVVKTSKNRDFDDFKTINLFGMQAYNTSAIKEVDDEVTKLKKRVFELEQEVKLLKAS